MSNRSTLMLILVLAIVAAALNLLGGAGLSRIPNLGYSHTQWAVQSVLEGGPASAAGLEVGDRIVTLEGIDVTDRTALSGLSRLEVGDLRTYGLERGDDAFDIQMVAERIPASQIWAGRANSLVGLVFLACGLFVLSRSAGRVAIVWAALGVAAAVAFANPPFRSFPAAFAPMISALFAAVALSAAALFAHLMLLFPIRRAWIDRRRNLWFLYLPVIATALLVLASPLVPAARGLVFSSFFWLQLVYVLIGAVVFAKSYRGIDPDRRRTRGLTRLVSALSVSLIPFFAVGIGSATGLITSPLPNQLSAILLVLVAVALTAAILSDAREPAA